MSRVFRRGWWVAAAALGSAPAEIWTSWVLPVREYVSLLGRVGLGTGEAGDIGVGDGSGEEQGEGQA